MKSHSSPVELSIDLWLVITKKELLNIFDLVLVNTTFLKLLDDKFILDLLPQQAKEILQAINADKVNIKDFFRCYFKRDNKFLEKAFKSDQTISLYYANYVELTALKHIAFEVPYPGLKRKFYLDSESAKKNIPTYSTVLTFSIFQLPLQKINWPMLCEDGMTEYGKKLENQTYTTILKPE